ncbi:MAG TPA: hypothetical protein VGS80_03915, partial [Ktedonobacterales bacterium]|nr:hypothetical protein [Ktedonobacterales bacterium]
MQQRMRIRKRGMYLLAIGLIVLALALSACGGRAAPGSGGSGYNGNGTTGASQQSGGSQTGGITPLDGDLQDIQSLMQQLDGAASDASFDYSSQDNPV